MEFVRLFAAPNESTKHFAFILLLANAYRLLVQRLAHMRAYPLLGIQRLALVVREHTQAQATSEKCLLVSLSLLLAHIGLFHFFFSFLFHYYSIFAGDAACRDFLVAWHSFVFTYYLENRLHYEIFDADKMRCGWFNLRRE